MLYENTHFSRYTMYRTVENWIRKHGDGPDGRTGKVVGGNTPLITLFRGINWEITDYPKVDAMKMPWEDSSIDIIIADQMLEHVKKPWMAASEMIRVLKPKGLMICTTCCMQRWHPPVVYFGFHPDGLRILFEGISSLEVGGWGNRWSNDKINFYDWFRHQPVEGSEVFEHFTEENDKSVPFTTWALGVK